jgi:hypothetical protein
MIAAAPIKAVLLWSVYAHHLCSAKASHPERVTLLGIDSFLANPALGPALLERIGRPASSAVSIWNAIDPRLWGSRASLRWRAGYVSVSFLCRALGGRLGPQRAPLADQRRWLRELRRVTDF